MRALKRFMVNTIVLICSCIVGLTAGALLVSAYLFIIGTFVPIEAQQGLSLALIGSICVGALGAMLVIVSGTWFWETFHWEWWR